MTKHQRTQHIAWLHKQYCRIQDRATFMPSDEVRRVYQAMLRLFAIESIRAQDELKNNWS